MQTQHEIMRVTLGMEGKVRGHFEGKKKVFVTYGQRRLNVKWSTKVVSLGVQRLEVSECGSETCVNDCGYAVLVLIPGIIYFITS